MTSDLQTKLLTELKTMRIITVGQYRRALAHPMFSELAEYSDLHHYVVWLVCRDILSEDELKLAVARVDENYSGEELERHNEMLGTALLILDDVRGNINQKFFDTLVAEDLLTPAERDLGIENMSSDNVLGSPAAALSWMPLTGNMSKERFLEICATDGAGSAERSAIITEAKDIFTKTNAAVRSAVIGATFPGPLWLWIAAPVLVVGYLVWSAVKPVSVPACTDSDIARTIDRMMRNVSIDARAGILGHLDTHASSPTVHGIKEVGFATEPRVRGCVGKIKIDDTDLPYAFTIAPSNEDKGDYAVMGAEPAIVQARFGKLDADGKFINKAEPLGRSEVERAFREGVAAIAAAGPRLGVPVPVLGLPDVPGHSGGLSTQAPERTREIAEVEPMAPCREIKPGTAYSCRLLVERNDPLLAVIGGSSTTLIDSAFTFERDSATGPWRVAGGFDEQYMKAVVAARVKAVSQ